MLIHYFKQDISTIPVPEKFTFPFQYKPHQLSVLAAEEVKEQIHSKSQWADEVNAGKMFGVLIVELEKSGNFKEIKQTEELREKAEIGKSGELEESKGTGKTRIAFLAAFSGNIAQSNQHDYFVPPVYDLLDPNGRFKIEEKQLTEINKQVALLEKESNYLQLLTVQETLNKESAKHISLVKEQLVQGKRKRKSLRKETLTETNKMLLDKESQFQKAELKRTKDYWKKALEEHQNKLNKYQLPIDKLKQNRRIHSAQLQQFIFDQFQFYNYVGEKKGLDEIFADTVHKTPPAGAGECALPKLLQYAFTHHMKPLAMAEFWQGASPKKEIRLHNHYYPSCQGKCAPILKHMLIGLEIENNPLLHNRFKDIELPLLYQDKWIAVVNKPSGMLSVPGKQEQASVYDWAHKKFPDATGPLVVHRLDMATSGLLIIAKDMDSYKDLQRQFTERKIQKRYLAILNGVPKEIAMEGEIKLPLTLNVLDRPRQIVDYQIGKSAKTTYELLHTDKQYTHIAFYPHTGRTHQLRVHAAHQDGLNTPILGDELYGTPAKRLHLHAERITFTHPHTHEAMTISQSPDDDFYNYNVD